MITFGLVTVLYNSETVIERFIESLSIQKNFNFKLYLIDNSPNERFDGIFYNLIEKTNINYLHYKCQDNFGVAKGNNIGIELALKDMVEYIVLLNNDIIIKDVSFFNSIFEIHKTTNEKIVVPKAYYPDEKTLWFAGGTFDKFRALGTHNNFNLIEKSLESNNRYITYAPTCLMSIKTEVFSKIGLMDEKYFVYVDDTDFVYRCVKEGIKLLYTPSLSYIHLVSVSSGGDNSEFYIYYANRNKIYFIRKHYPFFLSLLSISYHLLARTVFFIKFNSSQKMSLLKGLIDGFIL